MFPLIRALPVAGGSVSKLFPTIQPSPSPAPGSGGPQGGPSARGPRARLAAGRRIPVRTTALDSLESDLPLGGGQIAALIFLAAAVFTVAAARFGAHPPSPAPALVGPRGRLTPSAYAFPSARPPARLAAGSRIPARTAPSPAPPARLAAGSRIPARTAPSAAPPAAATPDASLPAAATPDSSLLASLRFSGGQLATLIVAAGLAAGIVRLWARRRG